MQSTWSITHFRFSEAMDLNAHTAKELKAFLSTALDVLGTMTLSSLPLFTFRIFLVSECNKKAWQGKRVSFIAVE